MQGGGKNPTKLLSPKEQELKESFVNISSTSGGVITKSAIWQFKVCYETERRRFRLPGPPTLSDLRAIIRTKYELDSHTSLKLFYYDEDNDEILLKDEDDIKEAFQIFSEQNNPHPVIKLKLTVGPVSVTPPIITDSLVSKEAPIIKPGLTKGSASTPSPNSLEPNAGSNVHSPLKSRYKEKAGEPPTFQRFPSKLSITSGSLVPLSEAGSLRKSGRIPKLPGKEQSLALSHKALSMSAEHINRLARLRAERNLQSSTIEPLDDQDTSNPVTRIDSKFFEKVNLEPDFLPSRWLEEGALCCRAVCKITIGKVGYGTGFLVASDLILTNNHVIATHAQAKECQALFGYEENNERIAQVKQIVTLDPDKLFITDNQLDYTFIAVEEKSAATISTIQPIPLLRNPITVAKGESINIIQHPSGRPKEVAFRSNKVKSVYDTVIWYETDTEPGSSGSPVFNDQWNLVGLHHAGWVDKPDDETKTNVAATNEGVRISSIVARLQALAKMDYAKVGAVKIHAEHILLHVKDSSLFDSSSQEFQTGFIGDYLNPAEVFSRSKNLTELYPSLVDCVERDSTYKTAGYNGRISELTNTPLFYLRITNKKSKKTSSEKIGVLLFASPHGREWLNPMILMELAYQLVTNYNPQSDDLSVVNNSLLLDHLEIFIIPQTNPDGANYSFYDHKSWRKNRSSPDGVDINRNFAFEWEADPDTKSEKYPGPYPLSEAETRNISDVVKDNPNILFVCSWHSPGEKVLRPLGASNEDCVFFSYVQNRMIQAITTVRNHTYISTVSEIVSGTSDDYFYHTWQKWSLLVQTGTVDGGFQPPRKEALSVLYEGVVGARELLKIVLEQAVENKQKLPKPPTLIDSQTL